ncbi:MAG TPA: exonuclease domain-containing protein [Candidatus Cloacimonadota bacterium]|nr:exonuclease domain-containing protein [Candidatus Cloacimonadota bacterium]
MNYIIDTETSGSSKEDRVISLAIGTFEHDHLSDLKIEMFNPGVPIKDGSRWVHKISDSMVKDKPKFKNTEFYTIIKDIFSDKSNVIIGHAIENDLYMIAREGIECSCRIIDTARCAKHIFNFTKNSLKFLKAELNLDSEILANYSAHTADGDVMITYLLLLEFLKYKSFDELIELTMNNILNHSLPSKKYNRIPIQQVIKQNREYVREVWLSTTNPSLRYCLTYHLHRNRIKAKMVSSG